MKIGQVIWSKAVPQTFPQFVWTYDGKSLVKAAEFRPWDLSAKDYAILRVNGIKPE